MLLTFLLCVYASLYRHCRAESITVGGNPNVTNLVPSISILRTTSIYSAEINLSLKVYQRSINGTYKDTLKVLSGATSVNSTGRCIAYGVSFQFWGSYPIRNPEETRNGGCDAIWGNQCSQSILTELLKSFGDIGDPACGVRNGDILTKLLEGCPQKNFTSQSLTSGALLRNGSFMLDDSVPMNLSRAWIYSQSDDSVDGHYNESLKNLVFTYFVGRPYGSGQIDTAIACMSAFNRSIDQEGASTPLPGGYAVTQYATSAQQLLLSFLLIVAFNGIS